MAEVKKMDYDKLMAEELAKATADVKLWNDAAASGEATKAIEDDLATAVASYNGYSQTKAFNACLDDEVPILKALRDYTYETIKVSDLKEPNSPLVVKEIVNDLKVIDLLKLSKFAKSHTKKVGIDARWIPAAQQLNYQLTLKVAKDVIGDANAKKALLKVIEETYSMTDAARKFKFSGADPTSNTQLLKAYQELVNLMVGPEFKLKSNDVSALLYTYAKMDIKSIKIVCSNHSKLVGIVAATLHKNMMNGEFAVGFKAKKN